MGLLFDTRIIPWALADSPRPSEAAHRMVANVSYAVFYSPADSRVPYFRAKIIMYRHTR